MNFSIATPPLPPLPGCPIGGGSKLPCVLRPLCMDLDLGPDNFFLVC